MATISKRQVRFSIMWDKEDPLNLTWKVDARAVVADDSENGGEKWMNATSGWTSITRADFATKTGAEIETLMINKSTEILQALGQGQGTHTIVNDLG
jgi:hypothetical protein